MVATLQSSAEAKAPGPAAPGLAALGLSALGVVFGDIGTSPLYTLKTVVALTGAAPTFDVAMGLLSLLLWTLIIVTTVKYVAFAMSVNNDGEGGILALMALLGIKKQQRPTIVAFGLFGAALIYGDGAITPAISVLSALEGLDIATPAFQPYILPMAVAILIGLFALQPLGTTRIGHVFGPIMLIWFVAIAVLGIGGVLKHPIVFAAFNPLYAFNFLASHGLAGFLVLGGVFLCVTGAEALYADMGHFGARPIRFAWSAVVFPALVLNYAGQTALLLSGASADNNIFYQLCPKMLLIPFVVLATVATVIASQSIITGAFSMTRQAIRLGWMPRLRVVQTSEEGYGQIYVGAINWLLMAVTLFLALSFKKSDNLAAAYGIAVSATMLMTSALLFIAMREIWNWGLLRSLAVASVFIVVDSSFFLANMAKVAEGGYVPLLLALAVYAVMLVWHRGTAAVAEQLHQDTRPLEAFVADLERDHIPRPKGVGVFLTRMQNGVPPVMDWHVRQNRALFQDCVVVSIVSKSIPWVSDADRMKIDHCCPGFWRVNASYGFMERPDLPALLKDAHDKGVPYAFEATTYYVGHETIVSREDGQGHPKWETGIFAAMQRNAVHVSDFLRLPSDNVVEIGRQVAI
jgi:KUP system potassium uptake protein